MAFAQFSRVPIQNTLVIPGTIETCPPLIVLKMRTRVRAPDTRSLAVR